MFDVTWSEVSEPVLVAASGDGTVLVFNQTVLEVAHDPQPSHVIGVVTHVTRLVSLQSYSGSSGLALWTYSRGKYYCIMKNIDGRREVKYWQFLKNHLI